MQEIKSSEHLFTKESKDSQVVITLYMNNYFNETYQICQPGEEGLFLGKSGNIDADIMRAQLALEALRFAKAEFKKHRNQ